MNLLPLYKNGFVLDGYYIQKMPICFEKIDLCQRFYEELQKKNVSGFYKCPKGLTVYYYVTEKKKYVFSSLRIKGFYNKRIHQGNFENINNPILSQEQALLLIQYSIENDTENKKYEEKRIELKNVVHDIKKLNTRIKEWSEILLEADSIQKNKELYEIIKSINLSSIMIVNRYALLNYETNPNALTNGVKIPFRIYANFEKMKNILTKGTRQIPIVLYGNDYSATECYQSFENVPFIILENAVKYSYKEGQEISITFSKQEPDELLVTVSSFSPFCSPEEINNVFLKGFRGKYAKQTSVEGSGIGLYFAKLLCDANNVDIQVSSSQTKNCIEDIEYSIFSVQLTFHNVIEYKERHKK